MNLADSKIQSRLHPYFDNTGEGTNRTAKSKSSQKSHVPPSAYRMYEDFKRKKSDRKIELKKLRTIRRYSEPGDDQIPVSL